MKVKKIYQIIRFFLLCIFLFLSVTKAQNSTWATGYRVGSAKRQIIPVNNISYNDGLTYDFGAGVNSSGTEVIVRSVYKFSIPTVIPRDAQVYSVKIKYRTMNFVGGFNTYSVDAISSQASYQQIWEHAAGGSYLDFFANSGGNYYDVNMPYSFLAIVNNALQSNSDYVYLGITSGNEAGGTSFTDFRTLEFTYYYHRAVSFIVKNNFDAGSLKVNSVNVSSGGSVNTYETITNTLEAIEPQSNNGINYLWNDTEGSTNKSKWERKKPGSTIDKGGTQSISPVAVYDDNGAEFVANMRSYNSVTFQNNFVGVGNGGVITVNGTQYNSPTSQFQVVEQNAITATASEYFVSSDWIAFSFNNWTWSGGSSTSSTITPTVTGNTTYTANYTGTARQDPMNTHFTSSNGQYISLAWTDHPNTNVTQYQVWRTVTGGSTSAIATLNRGTTSYTDYRYIQNPNGAAKLFYAVKAYYAPSGTWNDPAYLLNRGDLDFNIAQDNDQLNISSKEVPLEYSIGNFPNPFNPTTTINYQLPENGFVTIKVYDMLGKEVATLVNESKSAGYYNVNFDASKLTSGVYIYTINANNFIQSKKMLLMK